MATNQADHRMDYRSGPHHKMLRITAPHFVAGIEPHWRAAPILRYMLAWSSKGIRGYCAKKGWTVEELG